MDEISRRVLELTNSIFTNPTILPYAPELAKKIAGYNKLRQGSFDFGAVRWLVANQSQLGDFAVARGGINHLLNGLKEQTIVAGVVVLAKQREIISKKLVGEVWATIKDANWLDLDNGEFCWVNATFDLIGRDYNPNRFITVDPDTPM